MLNIQKNIPLSKYTSFKIGGHAKYFCAAENKDEIKEALEFAEKNKLEVFILGGGSNLLISDKGFDGLVVKVKSQKSKVKSNKIICGSGMPLIKLVNESVKNNLTGLEWAAGIPGTIGGAVVNNAGANGKAMSDIVGEVEILDIGYWILGNPPSPLYQRGSKIVPPLSKEVRGISGLDIKKLNNEECQFKYRDSVFKKEKKYIILSAVLKLSKGNQEKSKKIILEILKSRKEKQPLEYPSAGSVFKNPSVDDEHLARLIKEYPELNNISKNNTISAGWLIGQIDELKNKKIGGAMISKKHCNFIVNTSNAKAEDVVILISLIKQKVRTRFGIQLKEEIEYVGF